VAGGEGGSSPSKKTTPLAHYPTDNVVQDEKRQRFLDSGHYDDGRWEKLAIRAHLKKRDVPHALMNKQKEMRED
jgi:hypothetical protein